MPQILSALYWPTLKNNFSDILKYAYFRFLLDKSLYYLGITGWHCLGCTLCKNRFAKIMIQINKYHSYRLCDIDGTVAGLSGKEFL